MKAIRQVPKEIRKQTKVIAIIGEALIDAKITKLKNDREAAKHYFKKMVKK